MTKIKYAGATTSPGLRNYPLQLWDLLFGARHPVSDSEAHLTATMLWLTRAQDEGSDDGISRMYHLRTGWGASYPETTGYLIPTFLTYAQYSGEREFFDRAIRMAKWESEIQMPSGAVQGGVVTDPPSPAIFNTGQVLFGWCAAYEMTQSDEFRIPASSAAEYLVRQMDKDGAWRKNLSNFCDSPADTNAFNVRSAWALMRASRTFDIAEYKNAALANLSFVVGLSNDNGWIDKNCLNRPEQPLLHTIAYAYQGLLECTVLEQHEAALDVVLNGNQALLRNFERHGQLYGRYADCWTPTVRWRCLTGEAQTAIVWQRLGVVTGDRKWQKAAGQLTTQLKKTQSLHGKPGIAGGIKGSQPVTAPYGRLEFLNWAAKFFADALMLELGVAESSVTG